jgi:hypothetical protein
MDYPAKLDPRYINRRVNLPYGLIIDEVVEAVSETYRLFHGLNHFLIDSGFRPLEELLLGNSLSGIVSEFLVKNIARASEALEANLKIGGHPDLLPKGYYTSNLVLKGDEGIEVKASIHKGGWQGHNPEDSWLMIFRYAVGAQTDGTILALTFVEILCAKLTKSDWSFSGRREASRRTPTASITASGVDKLRGNFLYRIPSVGVGRHQSIMADP